VINASRRFSRGAPAPRLFSLPGSRAASSQGRRLQPHEPTGLFQLAPAAGLAITARGHGPPAGWRFSRPLIVPGRLPSPRRPPGPRPLHLDSWRRSIRGRPLRGWAQAVRPPLRSCPSRRSSSPGRGGAGVRRVIPVGESWPLRAPGRGRQRARRSFSCWDRSRGLSDGETPASPWTIRIRTWSLTMIHEVNGPRSFRAGPALIEFGAALRLWVFGVLIVGLATPLRTRDPGGRLGDLHRRDARARGIVGVLESAIRAAAACPRSAVPRRGDRLFPSSRSSRAEVTA